MMKCASSNALSPGVSRRKKRNMQTFTGRASLLVAALLILVLLLQACGSGTAPASQHTATRAPAHTTPPNWIALAGPYVHIINNVAIVDPRIYSHLDPKTVEQVLQAVARYNAYHAPGFISLAPKLIPFIISHFAVTSTISYKKAQSKAQSNPPKPHLTGCEGFSASVNWWGLTLFFNHCLVNDIELGVITVGAISTIITAFIPAVGELVTIAVAAAFGVLEGALQWADNHCGNRGANVNVSWAVVSWIASIC
jgi:hypothetical protein